MRGPITRVTNAAELDALFQQITELQCNSACDPITQALGDLCDEVALSQYRAKRARYLDGIENGRLEFNADYYQCVYNLHTANINVCDGSGESSCEGDLFTGKVTAGNPCIRDAECQRTDTEYGSCAFPEDAEDLSCSVGVCELIAESSETLDVVVMEGEPCGEQNEEIYNVCAGDLVCNHTEEMPVCVRPQTVADGEMCNHTRLCSENSYCLPREYNAEVYVCKQLASLNAMCSRSQPCELELYCDIQAIDMPGICKARIANGQACTSSIVSESDDTSCQHGSICIDQVCKPVRFEGESCEVSGQCRGIADEYTCQNNICTKVCE